MSQPVVDQLINAPQARKEVEHCLREYSEALIAECLRLREKSGRLLDHRRRLKPKVWRRRTSSLLLKDSSAVFGR